MTEQEFQRAFHDHKDAVYAFAFRMTGSVQLAEDVTQDCFLELLRRPHGFNPARGPLRQFLVGMARNLLFRHWRTARRLDPIDEHAPIDTPDPVAGPLAELVALGIQALPPLQREALILFEYEGFTLEEIANAVNADVGTVKSRLHRARERLRRVLAPLKNGSGGN
jgi:RNA polymerase sigma-70 factor (ECF subfamily)